MPSVSAWVSTGTFNRWTPPPPPHSPPPPLCCVSILFNKEPVCANNLCLKAFPDHSFMCYFPDAQHSQDLMIIGFAGTQWKERDTCQSAYVHARPRGDASAQRTTGTGNRENIFHCTPNIQTNGCQVSPASSSCVEQVCRHVKSIRGSKYTRRAVDW